jgi:shikimate dehydrogenase
MQHITQRITGRTRLYLIVADPIAHVKAPELLAPVFAEAGHDGVCVPLHVTPENLAEMVAALRHAKNLGGMAVTVPHKEAMAKLCDELTDPAREAGAVNVVRREADGRMVGAMFDGEGFVAGLNAAGHAVAGKRVFMAGAGGAAAGIAFALARHGAASITIANRTQAKAEALATRIRAAFPACALHTSGGPEGHDLAVNTTSLGLHANDAVPIDTARLDAGTVAVEIIMDPVATTFLRQAQARGLAVHPGLPMLDHQIRLIARFMGAIS